jgi:hypothetical protein
VEKKIMGYITYVSDKNAASFLGVIYNCRYSQGNFDKIYQLARLHIP